MNRQIRRAAYALLLLFGALVLNLARIQVVDAEKLASHPSNSRLLFKEYALERGAVITADGETVAQSKPTPERQLRFLRVFPQANLLAHVSGYYSVRFGRAGLELSYNKTLTGDSGVITMQDLGDRLLGHGRRGDTLVLSIDSRLQIAAHAALAGRPGAIVAIEPKTGHVVALVSQPSFNPNPLSQHSSRAQGVAWHRLQANGSRPLANRATSETYPPGSTFKIVTAGAALENGRSVRTSYPVTSAYQPPQTNRVIGNFGGASCGGDMAAAIRASCNTYFARLAVDLPEGALEKTARAFGFGETPPLDLRAAPSRLPSDTQLASPAFRALAAIGQFEVAATPLQMALIAATVANEGRVPEPQLVKEIRDARGVRLRTIAPRGWRRAVSTETARLLKQMMVSAVEESFARTADVPGATVGGKTGTAQTGRGDGSYSWVITFAPAERPQIAVAVVVEPTAANPNETGAGIAAPIAGAVMTAHKRLFGW